MVLESFASLSAPLRCASCHQNDVEVPPHRILFRDHEHDPSTLASTHRMTTREGLDGGTILLA